MNEDKSFSMIKKMTFTRLTFQEKMEMASDIFIEKLPRADICRKYCVKKALVNYMVVQMNSNKKFLEELINRQYTKEDKTQKIEEAAEMRLRQKTYIERAAQVRGDVANLFNV